MDERRDNWVRGVGEMLSALRRNPDLPYPKLLSDTTFVAMITQRYDDGELWALLDKLTRDIPEAAQEFYNWTEDRLPEMDRVRLVWMFGKVRYELDASCDDVYGKNSPDRSNPRPFASAHFIGTNINTVMRPEPSDLS